MQPGLLAPKKVLVGSHFVYANEQILQSDWSRAFLMRCILILIGWAVHESPLLLPYAPQKSELKGRERDWDRQWLEMAHYTLPTQTISLEDAFLQL